MWIHSSIEEEVEDERSAFLSVSVEFFWWIASQFSSECGGCCRDSAASSTASSASSTSSSTSSTTATASAYQDSMNGESTSRGGYGYGGSGLCLCTGHGIGRENVRGGCDLFSLVCGVFGVCEFSFR